MGSKQFTVFVSPARTKDNKENIPPPNSPIVLRSLNNKKRAPLRNLDKPKDELAFVYLDSQLVEPRARIPARRIPKFSTNSNTNQSNQRMVMMR